MKKIKAERTKSHGSSKLRLLESRLNYIFMLLRERHSKGQKAVKNYAKEFFDGKFSLLKFHDILIITWRFVGAWTRCLLLFRWAGWQARLCFWIVTRWFQMERCAIRLELEILQLANVLKRWHQLFVMFAWRLGLTAVSSCLNNFCHWTKATA